MPEIYGLHKIYGDFSSFCILINSGLTPIIRGVQMVSISCHSLLCASINTLLLACKVCLQLCSLLLLGAQCLLLLIELLPQVCCPRLRLLSFTICPCLTIPLPTSEADAGLTYQHAPPQYQPICLSWEAVSVPLKSSIVITGRCLDHCGLRLFWEVCTCAFSASLTRSERLRLDSSRPSPASAPASSL